MSLVESAPLILPLDAPEASVALVGGKGASLARLAAAGLPVPPGFLLTTAAYRRFVAANDLQPSIETAASGATADDPAALDRASVAIASLFQGGAMPAAVDAALRRAYAALGGDEPAVAARSSATAEDLPEFSFAGQQETVLNVCGEAALVAATRRCWESLWTARAIGYRRRMEIDQRSVAMGVVVQAMLAPRAAGVVFTANPATGDRGELLVNASYGLGEAIVSGQVTPDNYVLERAGLGVKERAIGDKAVEIVAAGGQGTITAAVAPDRRQRPALTDEQLRRLGELALAVETLFGGAPQDIEWALADGQFWLLQARPITNLPPAPLPAARWEPPTPGTAWIRRQVVEHMPGPLSPLFEELYLEEGLERSVDALFAAMGISGAFLEMMERPFLATVNGYAYMRASYKLRWEHVPGLLRYTASAIAMLFGSAIPLWRDQTLPAYLATIARWRTLDPAATDQELLAGVRELAWADAAYWWATALVVGAAKISDAVLDRFLALALPGRGLSSAMFLRGFPSTLRDAETALETIAAQIRADEAARTLVAATPAQNLLAALASAPAGQAPLSALRDYLARYGHQIYTLDFVEPTLGEETLPIALSLKALVEHPGRTALERQAAMAGARDRLTEETERSLDPLRGFLFRSVVRWAQRFAPYREEALFYVGAAWPTLRRLALELGRRLAEAGSLAAADDIFFLRTGEIEAASAARAAGAGRSDLARLAPARRALREARQRLHPPAAVPPDYRYTFGPFDISGFETQRRNALESATLRGFPVSPGRVTASASVIRSPAEFGSMEPGTILVCPTTTPAWTPLFAQARGLVTDIGGILAHGSIVAREYGIPAVMGTGNATQRIVSGQTVTVDGDAGTVTLLGTERT